MKGYLSYPLGENREGKNNSESPLFSDGPSQTAYVRSRSQPVQITEFRYQSGTLGYLVTGTIRPRQKQRKEKFDSRAEAEITRDSWEAERLRIAGGVRIHQTHLTDAKLRESEAAWEIAEKGGFSVLDAVMLASRSPTKISPMKPMNYQELYDLFVVFHKNHVSASQSDTGRQRCHMFGSFVGWGMDISTITAQHFTDWMKSRQATVKSKKSFNNYVSDVSGMFRWACEEQQGFLRANPASGVALFHKSVLTAPPRKRLSIETCEKMMPYLEKHHPAWCCSIALLMFGCMRPGFHFGEIRKLAECVERDGIDQYYYDGQFHLTEEITKTKEARSFDVSANLKAWLVAYPPTSQNIWPGDKEVYASIRKRFEIPHDGLRHTSISAHVAKFGSLAEAALQYGNSEKVIKRHYYRRMMREEADRFYAIIPAKK